MELAFSFQIPQNFTVLEEHKEDLFIPRKIWKLKVIRDVDSSLEIQLHSDYPDELPDPWNEGLITVSVPNHKNPQDNFKYTSNQSFGAFFNQKTFRFNQLSDWLDPTNGFLENGNFQLKVGLSIDYTGLIRIIVDNETFELSKHRCQAFSRNFSRILENSNKICLEDVKIDEVIDFLCFISENEVEAVEMGNVTIGQTWCLKSILKMAVKYECPLIIKSIETYLLNEKFMQIPEKLAIAREFEFKKLAEKCVNLNSEKEKNNLENRKFDDFSKETWQEWAVERAAKKVDKENADPNRLFSSKMSTSSRISPGKLLIDHEYLDEKFSFSFPAGRFKETMCEWTMIPRSCDSTGNLFITIHCHESSKSSLWSYKLVFLFEIRSEKNPIQTFRRQSFAEFDVHHKSIDIFIGKMSRFKSSHFISKWDNRIQIHGKLTSLRKCGVLGKWLEELRNADLKKLAPNNKMLAYQMTLAQKELHQAENLAEKEENPWKAQQEFEKSKKSAKIAEISMKILDSKLDDVRNLNGEQIFACLELGAKFHSKRFLEKCGKVLIEMEMPLELKLELAETFKLVELQEHCLEELKNQKMDETLGVIQKMETSDFDKKTWCLLARL